MIKDWYLRWNFEYNSSFMSLLFLKHDVWSSLSVTIKMVFVSIPNTRVQLIIINFNKTLLGMIIREEIYC